MSYDRKQNATEADGKKPQRKPQWFGTIPIYSHEQAHINLPAVVLMCWFNQDIFFCFCMGKRI